MGQFATKKTQRRMAQMTGASPRVLVRQRGGAVRYPAVGLRLTQLQYQGCSIAYCLVCLVLVYKQFTRKCIINYCRK